MGERKVINKYFPPDFDPAKIPRGKKANLNPNFVVRMMLPMSVRCNTCGEYMYKGKKFNSRKEDVDGPEGEYLGIKVLRFYFKCITCSAEFTIKTDPKNMDYAVEAGVRRNFELYKAEEKEKTAAATARAESEKDDPMAQLENKTKDSKLEMDILDALDEIRTQNARSASLNTESRFVAISTSMASPHPSKASSRLRPRVARTPNRLPNMAQPRAPGPRAQGPAALSRESDGDVRHPCEISGRTCVQKI